MKTLCLLAVAASVSLVPVSGLAAATGEAAPALALPDAQGAPIALDQLRGKVVYVDFWASWCGPCKRSFPWMNDLTRRYGPNGFVVVGVNVDKKRSDADRFLASVPAEFRVAFDPAGATPGVWAVKGMPSAYLIDRTGRIVMVEQGFREEQKPAVEERIRELLAVR